MKANRRLSTCQGEARRRISPNPAPPPEHPPFPTKPSKPFSKSSTCYGNFGKPATKLKPTFFTRRIDEFSLVSLTSGLPISQAGSKKPPEPCRLPVCPSASPSQAPAIDTVQDGLQVVSFPRVLEPADGFSIFVVFSLFSCFFSPNLDVGEKPLGPKQRRKSHLLPWQLLLGWRDSFFFFFFFFFFFCGGGGGVLKQTKAKKNTTY